MKLPEGSEPISSFDELRECVGRQVSVNAVALDQETDIYTVKTGVPRIHGQLRYLDGLFFIACDDGTFKPIIGLNFDARDPRLED